MRTEEEIRNKVTALSKSTIGLRRNAKRLNSILDQIDLLEWVLEE